MGERKNRRTPNRDPENEECDVCEVLVELEIDEFRLGLWYLGKGSTGPVEDPGEDTRKQMVLTGGERKVI